MPGRRSGQRTAHNRAHPDRYIGVAEVTPHHGNDSLHGAAGAFVVVVALAANPDQYIDDVTMALRREDFTIEGFDDIKLVTTAVRELLDDDSQRLLSEASSGSPAIGTFHTFPAEEADQPRHAGEGKAAVE